MAYSRRSALFGAHSLPQSIPQRQSQGAGLPTPPEEDELGQDAMAQERMRIELERAERTITRIQAHDKALLQKLEESEPSRYKHMRKYPGIPNAHAAYDQWPQEYFKKLQSEDLTTQRLQQERDGLASSVQELEADFDGMEDLMIERAEDYWKLREDIGFERKLWEAQVKELRLENEHLQHIVYMNALQAGTSTPRSQSPDRSDTRTLRQQLACMNEGFQSLTDKAARLQEQTAEAQRLLAQERQERLEERNQQLTVVVAKHGLERRMRNREQDLQTEWRRNAELSEKCQKLEEDLTKARARAREAGAGHGREYDLPIRQDSHHELLPTKEAPSEDDWTTDHHQHLPPEFGYSKFVRWKKRTRESHDRDAAHGKKQRRTSPEPARLQLAGSESPPQLEMETTGQAQATSGASAIDQMISGEFVESETPSRAVTPPG